MKRFMLRALFGALAFALAATPAYADVVTGTVGSLIGGTAHTTITSASATACTNLEVASPIAGQSFLDEIIDASGAGQSVTLTVYDEGTSPTCASADQIYAVQLLLGQVITLDIPVVHGISYKLSAPATNNIIITRT